MQILQVNSSDIAGGAEKVSFELHKTYMNKEIDSYLIVGNKKSVERNIIKLESNQYRNRWANIWLRLSAGIMQSSNQSGSTLFIGNVFKWIGQPWRRVYISLGHEDFDFPATKHILNLVPNLPSIMHIHNLHGGYFDLNEIPYLSKQLPIAITLHDQWLITGHCAYSLDCHRWEIGCGNCPDLTIYPEIKHDATKFNLSIKKEIFRKSQIYISTPSQWLASQVMNSGLNPRKINIINNGVDHSIFKPGELDLARHNLGLPLKSNIILFVAQKTKKNQFKDFHTLEQAVSQLTPNQLPTLIISIGGEKDTYRKNDATFIDTGYISDPRIISLYYQASDLYVHSAKSDNYPLTILEALSCGLPVVATSVGGIPEQIIEGMTGFLIPPGDANAMTNQIDFLISNKEQRRLIGEHASLDAKKRFSFDLQVSKTLKWYSEVIEDWTNQNRYLTHSGKERIRST